MKTTAYIVIITVVAIVVAAGVGAYIFINESTGEGSRESPRLSERDGEETEPPDVPRTVVGCCRALWSSSA